MFGHIPILRTKPAFSLLPLPPDFSNFPNHFIFSSKKQIQKIWLPILEGMATGVIVVCLYVVLGKVRDFPARYPHTHPNAPPPSRSFHSNTLNYTGYLKVRIQPGNTHHWQNKTLHAAQVLTRDINTVPHDALFTIFFSVFVSKHIL